MHFQNPLLQDLRAWKEGLEAFGAHELAALVRTLFMSDSRAGKGSSMRQGSQAFMKEVLELAADGGVELDGKAGEQCLKRRWSCVPGQARLSHASLTGTERHAHARQAPMRLS